MLSKLVTEKDGTKKCGKCGTKVGDANRFDRAAARKAMGNFGISYYCRKCNQLLWTY
ncbi:MAG: hypothetical protein ACE5J2_09105 [Nitrososphaerales archaeon]